MEINTNAVQMLQIGEKREEWYIDYRRICSFRSCNHDNGANEHLEPNRRVCT